MSTTELIELINKLPSDKQKEVEDIVQSMIANSYHQIPKKSPIEIKPGFGGGKGIFGFMQKILTNRWMSLRSTCNNEFIA